jgi:uncharacterized protein
MRWVLAAVAWLAMVAPAQAASLDGWFTASDGVQLRYTVSGTPGTALPTLVEFSPYGDNSQTFDPGPGYNALLVQIRGTGDSHGSFDALGPRTQLDVQQALAWACHQPFSNGRLALNGFSASAITIYNSLHLQLPCVKAALLKSGTFELYRDLLVPGGINNLVPGAGVIGLIGAPALEQGLDRDPATVPDAIAGLFGAGLSDLQHPSLDGWWRERGFRGEANHIPVLAVAGFFDVESRGAFQGFQRLRRDGAHLLVVGGHEGAPKGTDGGQAEKVAWLDHYVRGIPNGVDRHPRVQMLLSDGDREDQYNGKFVRREAKNWPVPSARWRALYPAADGSLGPHRPAVAEQPYAAVVTSPLSTDPPNSGIVGSAGANALTTGFPPLGDMSLTEGLGLKYTTPPLTHDTVAVGPAALRIRLSSTAPETAIWTVISDVSPDGVAHPLTAGRLLSAYPRIDRRRSLVRRGRVVQPLNRLGRKEPAAPGTARTYQVELWPIGIVFRAGHRIRLHIIGASAASVPSAPSVNTVTLGPTRLLLPVLP